MDGAHAYCTYFDSGYLSRGLALIESLRIHGDHAPIWVLALDQATLKYLETAQIPNVFTLTIADLEASEPRLFPLKTSRSRMEYYFTSTPLLVGWVLDQHENPAETTAIYLDSDLYFFDRPELVLDAMGTGSVGIIEHRYPPRLEKQLAKYGRFNVGWVAFRGDELGRVCLDWWAAGTLEWCSDVPRDGKYADQRYLDLFPEKFKGVVVLEPPGFNLAPWNTSRHHLTLGRGSVIVDGRSSLVFFHFHGLRRVGSWYVTSQLIYGSRLSRILRERVYTPYLRQLEAAAAVVAGALGNQPSVRARGNGWHGIASRLRTRAVNGLTIATGNAISLRSLQRQVTGL